MRLFLALKPDRPAEAKLAQRLLELQDVLGPMASSLRWMPATNVHATLQFLGEVDAARLGPLRDVLGATMAEASFDIGIGGPGVFPSAGAPRVIWFDVSRGAGEIAAVHAEIGRRLTGGGFAIEARPFSPHVTVARVPDRERARIKGLRERFQTIDMAPIDWRAEWVTLFRSDLSASVPRYEPLHEIALTTDPLSAER